MVFFQPACPFLPHKNEQGGHCYLVFCSFIKACWFNREIRVSKTLFCLSFKIYSSIGSQHHLVAKFWRKSLTYLFSGSNISNVVVWLANHMHGNIEQVISLKIRWDKSVWWVFLSSHIEKKSFEITNQDHSLIRIET